MFTAPVARRSSTPVHVVVTATPAGTLIVVKLCTPGVSTVFDDGLNAPSAPVDGKRVHAPATHGEPDPQTTPHAPQFIEFVRRSISHPSVALELQSAKPTLHATLHTPDAQLTVALAAVAQALSQRPQCASVVVRFTSHPSLAVALQSPKPVSHAAMPHRPERQNSLALGSEHTVPHAPQFAGSRLVLVHAPEQLVRPVPHEAEHVPAAQS